VLGPGAVQSLEGLEETVDLLGWDGGPVFVMACLCHLMHSVCQLTPALCQLMLGLRQLTPNPCQATRHGK
jgi:hypothetical protein